MQRAGILAILVLLTTTCLQAQTPSRSGALLPKLSHAFAPHAGDDAVRALPDTVRLLAVMVDFPEDTDNRTSGTGKFGSIYEYDYGTEILDPMPHNRAHFQQHLQFLENYVRKVSGRRTILKGEVLDGIVTVDGPISDYSFRKNESEAPVAKLAVEAWEKAVQQFSTVDFSRYHMFVVFHAGRGRDIDLVSIQGFDPTPFDLPSLSFTHTAFRRLLGNDFQGVDAGGGFRITNCAVLPTTNNREISNIDGSRSLLELTINGLLAASFGTWAGLPDLFDTRTGKTGIGRFGLMDGEGIFAYGGICPPAPSAWEKQRLGWTSPRIAASGTRNYLITAGDSLSTADVIRVPITDIEYWLVENRQRDLGGNGQLVTFVSGGQVQQLRFPKDTLGFDNGNVSQLKGVVIDVEDIDWSLPGGRVLVDDKETRINGGILIWHIDETALTERIALNTVNVTMPGVSRAVDLEQAGGPQDIGVDIQTVFGTQTGSGSAIDYWTKDNISPVYTNMFDLRSSPNSRANSGADARVAMKNFSVSGPIMTLDIAVGDDGYAPLAGFPVDFGEQLQSGQTLRYIRSADLDGDGVDELLAAASGVQHGFRLLVSRLDGTPYLPTGYVAGAENWELSDAPAVGDVDGDGKAETAVILEQGTAREVYVLRAADSDADGMLDVLYRQRFEGSGGYPALASTLPQIIHGALLLYVRGSAADSIIAVGSTVRSFSVGTPGFEPYADVRFLPLDEAGMVYAHTPQSGLAFSLSGMVQPLHFTSIVTAPISDGTAALSASADVDGDGKRELIVSRVDATSSGTSQILVASYALGEGTDADVRPIAERLPGDPVITSGAVACADVDGDGRAEILLRSGDGLLMAYNHTLAPVDNYPVYARAKKLRSYRGDATGDVVVSSGFETLRFLQDKAGTREGFPVAFPTVNDQALLRTDRGRLGIAAVSDRALFVFEHAVNIAIGDLLWSTANADSRNSGQTPLPTQNVSPGTEFFPQQLCYNWPNPAYDGVTRIRFFVSDDADVTVKIYDLAGDKVDELSTRARGGVDNEIVWDVSGIQSDVYLAKVEAIAPGKKGEKIIKIAVVR
ncbi:MAG: FG-GAP-like repeat-containing protein [Bacteroidia bacterium]|nr:FG-GAP-like repeat-containing protein [Bacteroidia bacterium]